MKNKIQLNEEIKKKIISILLKHGIKKILVFGSYARNEATPESDLDLLVEFPKGTSLFDHARIQNDLIEKLGIKVDLLTERAISPYIIDKVKKDSILIYE